VPAHPPGGCETHQPRQDQSSHGFPRESPA
jgi:hypothetical protein